MAKFRKKPVVIDAEQFIGGCAAIESDWLSEAIVNGTVSTAVDYAEIKTLEGVMRADRNDWVIRGVKGEIYPCKPDIFAATYEAAE